jgi:hypothetical protein
MAVSMRLKISSIRRLHSELREQQDALARDADAFSDSCLTVVTPRTRMIQKCKYKVIIAVKAQVYKCVTTMLLPITPS